MATPKQPQDRLPKQDLHHDEQDEYFKFEFDERTYMMPNRTLDVLTPGFVRKHRHDETDFVFSAIEALTDGGDPDSDDEAEQQRAKRGKEVLAVIDQLPLADWKRFQKDFQKHIGASLGE